MQPIEDPLHALLDLRVGEFLLVEPAVEFRHPRSEPTAPVAVGFETRCEFARLHDAPPVSLAHAGRRI